MPSETSANAVAPMGVEVLRAIRRILRRVSEHSRFLAREVGLTLPQLMCLRAIGDAGDEDEPTIAVVATTVQLSPATVSRIVDRLERADLVRRVRGTTDRRKVYLQLTPAGAQRHATLPIGLQERFLDRLAKLPADEQRMLLQALEQVSVMMDAGDLDVAPMLTPEPDVHDP